MELAEGRTGYIVAELHENLLGTVGNTPIVRLNHVVGQSPHTFYVKLEYFNPGHSVKDRAALAIADAAESRGELGAGYTIIEATSGNTGLGLAMIGAIRGYPVVLVMPDKVSEEKRAILRAFGAKVVVCPTEVEPEDARSYYSVAKKLVEMTPNAFYANQYFNEDNMLVHYATTAPEIWAQTDGIVDAVVAGVGTGGTLSGIGKYFREHHPKVKMIGVDPVGSILFDLFHHGEVRSPAHTYKIEGVGEDMLPGNVHFDVMDDFIKVSDEEAFQMCQDLVHQEGICVGPSSAMAVVGALKWAARRKKAINIVIVLPDHGRGYMSKAFNESWLRENGFLPNPLAKSTIADVIRSRRHRGVMTAHVEDTVLDVVQLMKQHGISQVPVASGDQIVGVLDESDLLLPLVDGRLQPTEPIIHLVRGTVIWAESEDSLQSLLDQLEEGYVALVRDESKSLHILTKIDVLDYLGELLSAENR